MGMLDRNREPAPDAGQMPAPGAGAPPSSGPAAAPSPQAGQSPGSLGDGGGPGQPPEERFVALRDKAVKMIYDDRFESLLQMFEKNGPERFPRSMAVAVNTVISELEKEGPLETEMAANVGMDIFMKLLQDVIRGDIVPGLNQEQMREALPATMKMYAQAHPNVTEEEVMQVLAMADQGVSQQGNTPPTGSPAAPSPTAGMGGAPGAGAPAPM